MALQDVAIRGLDDTDPGVVASAAAYLGEFGSGPAETALWAHFTAWSERWTPHEADLRYSPSQNLDAVHEAGVGSNMMQSLATGKAWLADEPKLRRLIQLSVGEQQRQAAEQWLSIWLTRPLAIQFIPSEKPAFVIAQYQANSLDATKAKLLQFPSGTVIQWRAEPPQLPARPCSRSSCPAIP